MINNEIKIFYNEEFGSVRTILIDDIPYFVARDVAEILGYANPLKAIRDHVDDEDKGVNEMDTPGGKQLIVVINESGLYSLIISSRLSSAKRFKRWITSEVLPALRKYGIYTMQESNSLDGEVNDKLLDVFEKTIRDYREEINTLKGQCNYMLTSFKQKYDSMVEEQERLVDQLRRATDKLAEAEIKLKYCDSVLNCQNLITTTEIAKDYGMTAKEFNTLLKCLDIQFYQSGRWFLHKQFDDLGYARTRNETVKGKDGEHKLNTQMCWTQKGRFFLFEYLNKCGIHPVS